MKRLGTFMERLGTVRNGQKRSCKRSCKRSGTVDAERSGTPRNVRVGTQQRSGTNSGKRSRYVHVHVSKTKETLYLETVIKSSLKIIIRLSNKKLDLDLLLVLKAGFSSTFK
jgi:hypothetical protein